MLRAPMVTRATKATSGDASNASSATGEKKKKPAKRKSVAVDPASTLDALRVSAAALTRPLVKELSARVREQGVVVLPLVAACLARHGADVTCALLFAGALAGQAPDAADVMRVLPDMSEPTLLASLVACASGDRVTALLDAAESGRASDEREALALYLAVHLAPTGEPASRLRTLLRLHARRELYEDASALIALAAIALGDADVTRVASRWLPDAQFPEWKKLDRDLRRALVGPLDEALPEWAPPKVVSGITVRRVVEKVGRNDPCPCGSGKKYKKCHEAGDAALLPAAEAKVAGMARTEYLERAAARMTIEDVQSMRAEDLERLDFAALAKLVLATVIRRLAAYGRWDAAERALDRLTSRADLEDPADTYRADFIGLAISAKAFDVATKMRARLDDQASLPAGDLLSLELVKPSADTIDLIEDIARAGLAEPKGEMLVELSHGLLDHLPALGIVVARGSLDPARTLDSNELLERIEEARDRLGLSPRDPAWDAFDELVDRDVARRVAAAADTEEKERLAAEADALRRRVSDASSHIATLERNLRAREDALRVGAGHETKSAPAVSPATGETAADAEQRRRMKQKIEDLKSQIAEGNRERADLRKQLATASDELAPSSHSPADRGSATGADETDEENDAADAAAAEEVGREVRVPAFAPSAAKGVGAAPPKVARDAIVLAAELAGGDAAAWRGCKRLLKPSPPVWSARVGIHFRLLFRPLDGRLDVLELIARKDFETVLKRYC
jgi:hypothetical protein